MGMLVRWRMDETYDESIDLWPLSSEHSVIGGFVHVFEHGSQVWGRLNGFFLVALVLIFVLPLALHALPLLKLGPQGLGVDSVPRLNNNIVINFSRAQKTFLLRVHKIFYFFSLPISKIRPRFCPRHEWLQEFCRHRPHRPPLLTPPPPLTLPRRIPRNFRACNRAAAWSTWVAWGRQARCPGCRSFPSAWTATASGWLSGCAPAPPPSAGRSRAQPTHPGKAVSPEKNPEHEQTQNFYLKGNIALIFNVLNCNNQLLKSKKTKIFSEWTKTVEFISLFHSNKNINLVLDT